MTVIDTTLMEQLQQMIGQPYGARGFTCWSFVRHVYAKLGVTLPDMVFECEHLFETVHDHQPWDVLIFLQVETRHRHLAVLLEYPRFIHCSGPTNGVAFGELTRDVYRHRYKRSVRLKEW